MTYRSPHEKRQQWLRAYHGALALLALFVLVSLLDFPLLHALTNADEHGRVDRSFETEDWYAMLRVVGSLWTWIVAGLALALLDRSLRRAIPVLAAPLVAGFIAELLKLVLARERPVDNGIIQDGFYHFRIPFSGFVDGSNLGLPSSHTAVAFGGMTALALIKPRLTPLCLLLALGCGLSRMLTGAHFATDVLLGAAVGILAARWIMSAAPRSDRKYTFP